MASRRILIASLFALLWVGLTFFYGGTNRGGLPAQNISPRPVYAAPSTIFKIYLPLILKNAVPTNPLWRFGTAKLSSPYPSWLSYNPSSVVSLRLGWYVDWAVTQNAPRPYGLEYVPTIHVKQWKLDGSIWTSGPCAGCPYVNLGAPSNPVYTYTVNPPISTIASIAHNQPGMTWLVGNEMERQDWYNAGCYDSSQGYGGQDEMLPELYAQAYRDIYTAIKSADSSAQVAIGGMVEFTPLRQKYLDRVWNAYTNTYGITMPVDIWNIHGFPLNEVSCQYNSSYAFGAGIPAGLTDTVGNLYNSLTDVSGNVYFSNLQAQIVALRTWMQQHGQQNKPLIITEYGVLYSDWICSLSGLCPVGTFSPSSVQTNMMYPSFTYFLNHTDCTLSSIDGCRFVQRWNWYSTDDDSGFPCAIGWCQNFNGNLFYSGLNGTSQGISQIGTSWANYVQPLPPGSNPPY